MKFRKKPIVVEASQFQGSAEPLPFSPRPVCCYDGERWYVTTIHGEAATIVPGDWIILEKPDDLSCDAAYPCKPDVFVRTYDPVEEI